MDLSVPEKNASHQGLFMRVLAWACVLLFAASTLPLYLISLYNHPYYDDYGFSAHTRQVWQETGSLGQTLQASFSGARQVRETWQGTYTGTLFSHLQPGLFSESLYFITTFFLLTVFLLCFGFFLKVVFHDLLGLSKWECVILISLALTLLVQFMPDPDEAFFWFNGGVGNTFIYSLLALSLGLCVKLERCQGRARQGLLMMALIALMLLLGGGSYGGGIFGLLIYALVSVHGFVRRSRWRWVYPALEALFLACFIYSMAAPGNALRSGMIASSPSAVKAILQALYYGIAIGGSYLRLPLIALTVLCIPFFAKAAERTPFHFRHPWLLLAGGICLYCTQFVPPLYAGVFIGGGRIQDTYYQSFVLLFLLYAFYLTGFVLRRYERTGAFLKSFTQSPPSSRWLGLVVACSVLLVVGSLAYKRPHDAMQGPQNMAGGSAALSLLRGEAQRYDREMEAREALLNDISKPHITLAPLSVVPDIFMKDLLAFGAGEDVKPVLCAYYGKESITLEGER